MRPATAADTEEITACLRTAAHQAMFTLGYLHRDGFAGQGERTMKFWVNNDGPVTDVLALTRAGIVAPFLPNMPILGAKRALAGAKVTGMIGPLDQVRSLQRETGLDDATATLDQDEPHYTLALDELQVPDGPGDLRLLSQADPATMLDWMTQYQTETLNTPASEAPIRAAASYETAMVADNRRVLMWGDVPLATTAFNAQLPDMVQIGGVFTPRELRGKGHGRRVVALHLAEARDKGVTHAALSAANAAAAKAYVGIGFQQVGEWAFRLFQDPQVIRG